MIVRRRGVHVRVHDYFKCLLKKTTCYERPHDDQRYRDAENTSKHVLLLLQARWFFITP